jgi:hypothetical protein
MKKQNNNYYADKGGASGRGGRNEGGTGGYSKAAGAGSDNFYKDKGGLSGMTGRNKGGMSGCGLIDSKKGLMK